MDDVNEGEKTEPGSKLPEIPDELWGLWDDKTNCGWNGKVRGEWLCAYTSRFEANRDNPLMGGGVYGTVELLGVSPARLATAIAERDEARAEVERLKGESSEQFRLAATLAEQLDAVEDERNEAIRLAFGRSTGHYTDTDAANEVADEIGMERADVAEILGLEALP